MNFLNKQDSTPSFSGRKAPDSHMLTNHFGSLLVGLSLALGSPTVSKAEPKTPEFSLANKQNSDHQEEIPQNLDSLSYIQLHDSLKFLTPKHSTEIWEAYFKETIRRLEPEFTYTNTEEAFNYLCETYHIVETATKKKITYNNSKTLAENIAGILPILLKEIAPKTEKENNEKDSNIRGERAKNAYSIYAYMVYYENAKEEEIKKKYLQLKPQTLAQVHKKHIQRHHIKHEVMENLKQDAQKLEIFDTQREFLGEGLREEQKHILKNAYSKGIRLRKNPNKNDEIFVYTKNGHFIDSININENFETTLHNITEEYEYILLKDGLKNLTIDREKDITPNYIIDDSGLKYAGVPKKYIKQLQEYKEKGYQFEIQNVSSKGNITLRVTKNNSMITEVTSLESTGQKANLWAEILLKSLKRHENEGRKVKLKDYPENIEQNTDISIEFINRANNAQTHDIGKLFNIGRELKMPLKQIFRQLELYYREQMNHIAPTINNFHTFLPNDFEYEFLLQMEISPKEYNETKYAFNSLALNTLKNFIQHNPQHALENAESLTDYMMSIKVHMFNALATDNNGVSDNFLWIIQQALYADPSLQNSDTYKKLIKKYPGITDAFKTQNADLSSMQEQIGGKGDTFANAERVKGHYTISRLQKRMKHHWLLEYKNFPQEEKSFVSQYQLMVARNIYLQFLADNKIGALDGLSDEELKTRTQENIAMIFEERTKYQQQKIFGQDMFFVAHYGQDVPRKGFEDSFGRKATKKALQSQIGNSTMNMLDGEEIYAENDESIQRKLDEFLEQFIRNPHSAQILLEGHANGEGFSFVHKYEKRDNLGINEKGTRIIEISPEKIVSIIKERNNFRKQHNITTPDSIVFMACRGDYAVNTLAKTFENQKESLDLPIFMTAAETGQDSWYNWSKDIPYNFLREGLKIGKQENVTYKTFFESGHYNKDIDSNPVLFVPVQINGKIIPQQIG